MKLYTIYKMSKFDEYALTTNAFNGKDDMIKEYRFLVLSVTTMSVVLPGSRKHRIS